MVERELEAFMKTMGFHRASSDAGVFIYKHHDGRLVIALVYVDDGLFLGADKALVDSKKRACLEHWECRDTGDVTDFLGMKVNKTASRITIDQKAYLKTVLERFRHAQCQNRPYTNPVGLCTHRKTKGLSTCAATKSFSQSSGLYCTSCLERVRTLPSRVIKMSQFSANPSQDHLDKPCTSCATSLVHKITTWSMMGGLNEGLIAHTDSDWAGDPIKRRSTTGFFASLASGIVCWQSRLQKTVALSLHRSRIYGYVGHLSTNRVDSVPVPGNLATIWRPTPYLWRQSRFDLYQIKSSQERRTKHIDIAIITYASASKMAKCLSTSSPGNENPADMFTKNLGAIDFLRFRKHLGIKFLWWQIQRLNGSRTWGGGVGIYSPLLVSKSCDLSRD